MDVEAPTLLCTTVDLTHNTGYTEVIQQETKSTDNTTQPEMRHTWGVCVPQQTFFPALVLEG